MKRKTVSLIEINKLDLHHSYNFLKIVTHDMTNRQTYDKYLSKCVCNLLKKSDKLTIINRILTGFLRLREA